MLAEYQKLGSNLATSMASLLRICQIMDSNLLKPTTPVMGGQQRHVQVTATAGESTTIPKAPTLSIPVSAGVSDLHV
jgi:hypothetical protein